MRMIKSGIIGGVTGVALLIINILILMYLAQNDTNSIYVYFATALTLLATGVIPGTIAGLLASRGVTNKKDAVTQGIIAGSIAVFAIIIYMAIYIVTKGSSGFPYFLSIIWSFMLFITISVVLACVCSVLAVFFTSNIYWSIPSLNSERDPDDLRRAYDEMWAEARNLIVDINRSIRIYLFAGVVITLCGITILANGEDRMNSASVTGLTQLGYIEAMCETAGGLILLALGPYLLYWYRKLKKRYSRLMQMEKTFGV